MDIFISEIGGLTNEIYFLASQLEDMGEGFQPPDWVAISVSFEAQEQNNSELRIGNIYGFPVATRRNT
jgi:hypothetical protein